MKDIERRAEALLSGTRRALTPSAESRHNVRVALTATLGALAGEFGAATVAQAQVGTGGTLSGATGGAPGVLPGGESVAAGGGATAPAGVATAAAKSVAVGKSLMALSVVKTIAVIGAVGGITAGVAWVSDDSASHRSLQTGNPTSSASAPRSAAEGAGLPSRGSSGPQHGEPSLEPDPLAVEPADPNALQPGMLAPDNDAGRASSGRDVLQEEIALLQRAQRAAQQHQPALVLALLSELDARFGPGSLWQEREVTRVLALCSLGRTTDARRTARHFLSANPKTLYVERISKSCAGVEHDGDSKSSDSKNSVPQDEPSVAKFRDAGD